MRANSSISLAKFNLISLTEEDQKEINGGGIPAGVAAAGAIAGKVLVVGAVVCGVVLVGAAVGYGCYKLIQWATK